MSTLRKYFPSKYGYFGKYRDYHEALNDCTGYECQTVVSKTSETTTLYKNELQRSLVIGARDQQFLYSLLYAINHSPPSNVNILDFGGALGNHYLIARQFIPEQTSLSWTVCETAATASEGNKNHATTELAFSSNLEELTERRFELIVASGVLQCVDKPMEYLNKLLNIDSDLLFINRFPLIESNEDRLAIQKVSSNVSYPVWFFSNQNWSRAIGEHFDIIARWDVPEDTIVLDGKDVICQGMLLKKKVKK